MRKCFKLLTVAFLAIAAAMPVLANNSLTVYPDADNPTWDVPVNLYYMDEVGTRSQVIYPAEVLSEMEGEAINSITFYTYSNITATGGKIRVSVGETTQTSFGSYVEGLTQVAVISITPGTSQLTINFDSPFPYGGGNLVFDAVVEETGVVTEPDMFICERLDNYCGISRGEITRSIPMATFDYGSDVPFAAKVLPGNVTFKAIRAERVDVQSVVLKNVGSTAFTPSFSATAPFAVDLRASALEPNASLEVPVKFAPTAAGDYTGTLSIDCGGAGVLTVALSGTALKAAQDLTVCDSLASGTLPIDGVYIDIVGTEGQMIYPAEMLTDMLNSKVVEIKFYPERMKMNGGVVTLSLTTTEQAEYTEETLLTGLTAVATATPVQGSDELVFRFDEPFEYTGGNLVVDALVTTAGDVNYESSTFFGQATDVHASLEAWDYYGYAIAFVDFLPKATFAYQKDAVEPDYDLGDVNHDGKVDVSDVTALIAYILGNQPDVFYIEQANVNQDADGKVDVSDVTALIAMILGS